MKETSIEIMEHADEIKYATEKTTLLIQNVDGTANTGQVQGQKSQSQFETLKALIEGQRNEQGHPYPRKATYADKTKSHVKQRIQHHNNQEVQKAEADQPAPPHHPAEPRTSNMRKRGIDDRILIDHHLED